MNELDTRARPLEYAPPPGGPGKETWTPSDEPTLLERVIAAQFRRGIAVPLTPKESQDLGKMSLEQRCAYIAKIVVWTARAVEKQIIETGK